MKKTFIESSLFTAAVYDYLDEESFAEHQHLLMQDPGRGAVMPGCGGLRKLRTADTKRRKGKRGGARIIYLHVPEVHWIYLLDIFGKNQKEVVVELTALQGKGYPAAVNLDTGAGKPAPRTRR